MPPRSIFGRGNGHASSGHLERRGIGDVDTLTVGEYHRLPVGLIGSGWQLWLSTMAINPAAMAAIAT